MEHVTRPLMVGSFRQPRPSRTAVERLGQLEAPRPPLCANEHIKREEESDLLMYMLTCSAAPQATPRGGTQLGATHECCRANRAPGCRDERMTGGGLKRHWIAARTETVSKSEGLTSAVWDGEVSPICT